MAFDEHQVPGVPAHAAPPSASTPFDALLTQFRALSDSKRMQGNYLEALARHYLRGEPQWADQIDDVWLWQDWPDRQGRPDTGIDLVASLRNGGLMAVQVKFFAADHRVQKGELDSFFEALGREPFTEGLVVDTAVEWSTHALDALRNRSKPVRHVTLDHLRHSMLDWSTYELTQPQHAPDRHQRKQLRAHQHRAVAQVMEAFGDERTRRGKLLMACGTGKTFTALKLAERWTRERAGGNATILFAVPSLALLQQSLEEWAREHDPDVPFTAFAVGSDDRIGRVSTGDITSVRMSELGAPATTDGAALARMLEEREIDEGMTVVFSTYQSIEAVSRAQHLGAPAFDLIICDEAHRTTGVTLADEDASHFVKVHDDDVVQGERRIYMTATPRIYSAEIKNTARAQDAELLSMDDESIYGPVLYRIGFGEAVEEGLLTDYKVLVLGVSEDQIASGFQQQLASDGHELQLSDVAKLIGCWNGLAKRQAGAVENDFGTDLAPMRRAVAFAKDIKTSKAVAHDFPALVDGYLTDLLNDDTTDDLAVHAKHVDGTMNATERGVLLDWLKEDVETANPVTRILTNARCLSEGVDVPSLDAVLFLNPRKSQVDVVQAVGRVMRRAEGKQTGYIVLPIAVPADVTPEAALGDNERYKVVWQVLQALRSHDERLDAQINQMGLTGKTPETVVVQMVDLRRDQRQQSAFDGSARDEVHEGLSTPKVDGRSSVSVPLAGFGMQAAEWKDAVYAKLVKTVGDRLYWDDWAKDIGEIATTFITLIRAHLDAAGADTSAFDAFVDELQTSVNPDIDRDEAIELVAQHLITMPIFAAMFPDGSFSTDNPVSQALDGVVDALSANAAFERERRPLDDFYSRVTSRIRGLDDVTAKQKLLVTLYDRFFKQAFPALAERMGIVFTPVEIVDYILRSADDVTQRVFDRALSDEGVRVIDPFVGTGTFMARLFQAGLIQPEDLERKFRSELFANEVVLLSYYIAAVNIESVYRAACAEAGVAPGIGGFPGISLADTFATVEKQVARGQQLAGVEGLSANTARIEAQMAADLDVIVMNPPYSVGQKSGNDAKQSQRYPEIDRRIAETYAARSTAQNKNGLYDSYYRALRWATDRIGDRGVIAFVSNSGFVDGGTADGVRLTWAEEFTDIFVFNLRGNQRTQGEVSRREGGKVFGSGSRTGVAICVLVKDPARPKGAQIHYRDVGDYLTAEQKLEQVGDTASIDGTEFDVVVPNDAGDWINQRDESFGTYQPMGAAGRGASDRDSVFAAFVRGVETGRDAWAYNFGVAQLDSVVERSIATYGRELQKVEEGHALEAREVDPREISWTSTLVATLKARRSLDVSAQDRVVASYRPFVRQHLQSTRRLVHRPGVLREMFPTPKHPNIVIAINSDARRAADSFMTDRVPDLHFNGDAQCFARWTWQLVEPKDGGFDLEAIDADGEIVDGYRRVDNITDHTLAEYRRVYEDVSISKDDIFFYVYGLLHHPTYRERYEADLKKLLPRIPRCAGFAEYARIGRALADLHLGYEDVAAHPLDEQVSLAAPDDPYERYRITKLAWTARKARTGIKVNEHVTITGIPEEADLYKIGGRSPLEWIIDRYQVKTDKDSGIVNDPNDWLREQGNPRYVVDLIASLVTVSLETQRLMAELPPFEVIDPA